MHNRTQRRELVKNEVEFGRRHVNKREINHGSQLDEHKVLHNRPLASKMSISQTSHGHKDTEQADDEAAETNAYRKGNIIYVCVACGWKTTKKNKYIIHEQLKHGTRLKVSCSLCQKSYSKNSNLQRHIAREHGEKSIIGAVQSGDDCPSRGKRYSKFANVESHSVKDHGKKSLKCTVERRQNKKGGFSSCKFNLQAGVKDTDKTGSVKTSVVADCPAGISNCFEEKNPHACGTFSTKHKFPVLPKPSMAVDSKFKCHVSVVPVEDCLLDVEEDILMTLGSIKLGDEDLEKRLLNNKPIYNVCESNGQPKHKGMRNVIGVKWPSRLPQHKEGIRIKEEDIIDLAKPSSAWNDCVDKDMASPKPMLLLPNYAAMTLGIQAGRQLWQPEMTMDENAHCSLIDERTIKTESDSGQFGSLGEYSSAEGVLPSLLQAAGLGNPEPFTGCTHFIKVEVVDEGYDHAMSGGGVSIAPQFVSWSSSVDSHCVSAKKKKRRENKGRMEGNSALKAKEQQFVKGKFVEKSSNGNDRLSKKKNKMQLSNIGTKVGKSNSLLTQVNVKRGAMKVKLGPVWSMSKSHSKNVPDQMTALKAEINANANQHQSHPDKRKIRSSHRVNGDIYDYYGYIPRVTSKRCKLLARRMKGQQSKEVKSTISHKTTKTNQFVQSKSVLGKESVNVLQNTIRKTSRWQSKTTDVDPENHALAMEQAKIEGKLFEEPLIREKDNLNMKHVIGIIKNNKVASKPNTKTLGMEDCKPQRDIQTSLERAKGNGGNLNGKGRKSKAKTNDLEPNILVDHCTILEGNVCQGSESLNSFQIGEESVNSGHSCGRKKRNCQKRRFDSSGDIYLYYGVKPPKSSRRSISSPIKTESDLVLKCSADGNSKNKSMVPCKNVTKQKFLKHKEKVGGEKHVQNATICKSANSSENCTKTQSDGRKSDLAGVIREPAKREAVDLANKSQLSQEGHYRAVPKSVGKARVNRKLLGGEQKETTATATKNTPKYSPGREISKVSAKQNRDGINGEMTSMEFADISREFRKSPSGETSTAREPVANSKMKQPSVEDQLPVTIVTTECLLDKRDANKLSQSKKINLSETQLIKGKPEKSKLVATKVRVLIKSGNKLTTPRVEHKTLSRSRDVSAGSMDCDPTHNDTGGKTRDSDFTPSESATVQQLNQEIQSQEDDSQELMKRKYEMSYQRGGLVNSRNLLDETMLLTGEFNAGTTTLPMPYGPVDADIATLRDAFAKTGSSSESVLDRLLIELNTEDNRTGLRVSNGFTEHAEAADSKLKHSGIKGLNCDGPLQEQAAKLCSPPMTNEALLEGDDLVDDSNEMSQREEGRGAAFDPDLKRTDTDHQGHEVSNQETVGRVEGPTLTTNPAQEPDTLESPQMSNDASMEIESGCLEPSSYMNTNTTLSTDSLPICIAAKSSPQTPKGPFFYIDTHETGDRPARLTAAPADVSWSTANSTMQKENDAFMDIGAGRFEPGSHMRETGAVLITEPTPESTGTDGAPYSQGASRNCNMLNQEVSETVGDTVAPGLLTVYDNVEISSESNGAITEITTGSHRPENLAASHVLTSEEWITEQPSIPLGLTSDELTAGKNETLLQIDTRNLEPGDYIVTETEEGTVLISANPGGGEAAMDPLNIPAGAPQFESIDSHGDPGTSPVGEVQIEASEVTINAGTSVDSLSIVEKHSGNCAPFSTSETLDSSGEAADSILTNQHAPLVVTTEGLVPYSVAMSGAAKTDILNEDIMDSSCDGDGMFMQSQTDASLVGLPLSAEAAASVEDGQVFYVMYL